MAKALTTHLRKCDFYAALVADHAAMLHALILAAQALPVGDGAENARAKQAVAFRFERTVVDGLRLGDFAVRPAPDLLRRSKADANRVEVRDRVSEFKWVRAEQFVLLSCHSSKVKRRTWWPLRDHSRLPSQFLRALPPARAWETASPIPQDQSAAMGVSTKGFSPTDLISSTSRHSDCNSRINTLKDSGTPGSMAASPLTIAS